METGIITGTIKRIKVNPETDKGAVLFTDGRMFYIESLGMVKSLRGLFRYGNPIGEVIQYELSDKKIDGDGVIKRVFARNVIIG